MHKNTFLTIKMTTDVELNVISFGSQKKGSNICCIRKTKVAQYIYISNNKTFILFFEN